MKSDFATFERRLWNSFATLRDTYYKREYAEAAAKQFMETHRRKDIELCRIIYLDGGRRVIKDYLDPCCPPCESADKVDIRPHNQIR